MNKIIFFVTLAVCGYWTMRVVDAPVSDEIESVQELHAMDAEHLSQDDWGTILEQHAGADVSAE